MTFVAFVSARCSYIALAHAAITHNLVRPTMTRDSVLLIRDGRHLLKETKMDTFVANSTSMFGPENQRANGNAADRVGGKIHIVTGPNNSGSWLLGRHACGGPSPTLCVLSRLQLFGASLSPL